jgi:hypothetical protein
MRVGGYRSLDSQCFDSCFSTSFKLATSKTYRAVCSHGFMPITDNPTFSQACLSRIKISAILLLGFLVIWVINMKKNLCDLPIQSSLRKLTHTSNDPLRFLAKSCRLIFWKRNVFSKVKNIINLLGGNILIYYLGNMSHF